jgi:Transcriptional regulator containing an amidase domain and an AraC-type DNA-binding HTH domain
MIPETIAENGYYSKEMPDSLFGIDVFLRTEQRTGTVYRRHWHEQLQLYSFVSGRAFLDCGGRSFSADGGDIVVINSCEPHYMVSRSDDLSFYIIRIDLPFLFSSQIDSCQTKFMVPLVQNRITFGNLVQNDGELAACVSRMIREYTVRNLGYELAVKAAAYEFIVLLIRKHISRILTEREFSIKTERLKRYEEAVEYINAHYAEQLTVAQIAKKARVSVPHFCRTFRDLTGGTFTGYLNNLRLEAAAGLLRESSLPVTDIALRCGFDSVNYFSRLFRNQYNTAPSEFRKLDSESPDAVP